MEDMLSLIISSSPEMKRMVKQNPEMGQVMKDPATIRQMMEVCACVCVGGEEKGTNSTRPFRS